MQQEMLAHISIFLVDLLYFYLLIKYIGIYKYYWFLFKFFYKKNK